MNPSHAPFTPTGLHSRPVALGDSAVVVFNHLREQLDVLHCSGGIARIPMPEMRVDWHFPIPHGAATLDSQIVFLWSNPVVKRFDGTHGVLWDPEQGVQSKVLFEGDIILVGGSPQGLFLVEQDIVPTTMRIPADRFRRLFER
ncbi:MAG: hypothetical protein ACREKM_04215 [Longimicrobiales bacterium]